MPRMVAPAWLTLLLLGGCFLVAASPPAAAARPARAPRLPSGTRAGVVVREASLAQAPTFTQHVVPVLNRYGCASGMCHGSFSGRGGLRLSLFGHDPRMDFSALVRMAGGRRVNRV